MLTLRLQGLATSQLLLAVCSILPAHGCSCCRIALVSAVCRFPPLLHACDSAP